jgi:hypothetical protein
MEPDEMFLEAGTILGAGALFLGNNGSPPRFAESFDHRGGGKEAVPVCGPGISLLSVSGGNVAG